MIELTYEGFKEWLQSKQPEETVGSNCNPYRCPIAIYLTQTYEQRCYAGVNYGYRYKTDDRAIDSVNRWGEWHATPDWALQFMMRIDIPVNLSIIARDALAALEGLS